MSVIPVKPDNVVSRVERSAVQLMEQFSKSTDLLQVAMQEAVPWAGALVAQRRLPRRDQLERLAAQLLAILMASETNPVDDKTSPKAAVSRFGA